MNIEKAQQITGWMSKPELEWIARRAAECKGTILEVGCYKGRSTRAWCDNTKAMVYAIDPWEGDYITERGKPLFKLTREIYDEFRKNTEDCMNLTVYRGTLPMFRKVFPQMKADLVFIDGDHRYDAVMHDIACALDLTKPGGIIAGHDYSHTDWPGVKRAVDSVFKNISQLDSIWWIKNP
jgi:predicted O-methyltransferase YrrM